jgi:hypothetical protein
LSEGLVVMNPDDAKSLSDEPTFTGHGEQRRRACDMSLGDERTLGDGLAMQDTVIDDIEVVDPETRYKVEGTLGQGGMGAVLLATDTRLGRKVVIERILGEAAGARLGRLFNCGDQLLSVVRVYQMGVTKNGSFLVSECIDDGGSTAHCDGTAAGGGENFVRPAASVSAS